MARHGIEWFDAILDTGLANRAYASSVLTLTAVGFDEYGKLWARYRSENDTGPGDCYVDLDHEQFGVDGGAAFVTPTSEVTWFYRPCNCGSGDAEWECCGRVEPPPEECPYCGENLTDVQRNGLAYKRCPACGFRTLGEDLQ